MYPILQFGLETFIECNMTENCKFPYLGCHEHQKGTVDNLRQIGMWKYN